MMESQTDIIIKHMKEKGAITALEALRRYGIGRLAARIADAKKRGIRVKSETVTSKTRLGRTVRYARYMIEEQGADE